MCESEIVDCILAVEVLEVKDTLVQIIQGDPQKQQSTADFVIVANVPHKGRFFFSFHFSYLSLNHINLHGD